MLRGPEAPHLTADLSFLKIMTDLDRLGLDAVPAARAGWRLPAMAANLTISFQMIADEATPDDDHYSDR
ncbi:hypothetical protein JCM17846_30710 [Iodidimonas nitroreducens]|uniref:Uncharacterized protein n=1 Tax=Iodidimonas nitroreducens TaxID=1236968 RepID=A0A5A7NEA2_9PROT|nr:hypothetical protein JCM17846_30710 [Iodidimonas nitroreducens]